MLAAFLLVGLVTALLSSVALFVPRDGRRSVAGPVPAARRLAMALLGTAALAGAAYVVLRALHVPPGRATTAVVVFALTSVAWLPVTRRWSGRAHLTWASSQFLFLAYLVFILQWTVASGLGFWTVAGGLLLWVFEVVAGVLASAYLWELCDTLGSEYWRRRVTRSMSDRLAASSYEHDGTLPFVSMHVPAHNEPPEMVIETLQSLQRLDYPHFEIIATEPSSPAPWA
jgi:hypothetical protein